MSRLVALGGRYIANTPAPTPPPAPTPAPPPAGPGDFVTRDGPILMYQGSPLYLVGTNNFGLTGCQSPLGAHTRAEMVTYFSGLRQDGNMAVRVWFFPHSNATDMDNCVSAAEEVGIFIIPVLFEGAGHCGINYTANRAWYQSPSNTYTWIDYRVDRHKNSTAIAWWECCNEMGQGSGGDMTQAECKNWLSLTSARIKLKDPNHLVGSGCIGSWKSYHLGTAGYQDVHSASTMDLISSHEYEYDYNGNTGVQGRHAQELAAAAALNKPLYIGEFGTSRSSGTSSLVRSQVTVQKFDAYLGSSASVCGVIHWSTTKAYNATDPQFGIAANETYDSLTSVAIRDYSHARLLL